MAKAFLKSQNIPFEEKDVLTDLAAREEMVKKSGQLGVPVIDVEGKIMVGFDQGELTRLVSDN
jgi:glutaredoxin